MTTRAGTTTRTATSKDPWISSSAMRCPCTRIATCTRSRGTTGR
uniref:Uncharacterized protein n=1 Tax=Arundo donax TaxID=35708 RepID=A0A0A9H5F7_ARUDO